MRSESPESQTVPRPTTDSLVSIQRWFAIKTDVFLSVQAESCHTAEPQRKKQSTEKRLRAAAERKRPRAPLSQTTCRRLETPSLVAARQSRQHVLRGSFRGSDKANRTDGARNQRETRAERTESEQTFVKRRWPPCLLGASRAAARAKR